MKMLDKAETRLKSLSVTSYTKDFNIDHTSRTTIPLLNLTIGSAQLSLRYNNEADRNRDFSRLDDQTGLEKDS